MMPAPHDFKPGDLIDFTGIKGMTKRGVVDEETTYMRVWMRFYDNSQYLKSPVFTTRYTDVILIERNTYDLEPLDA